MSKTLLVAQREFVENLRTKTFWLGILAAPIGIVLFYGMMFLLADKTDERRYVVLDRSKSEARGEGWLSKAVFERAKTELLREKAKEAIDEGMDEHLPDGRPLRKLFDEEREAAGFERFSAWFLSFGEDPLGAIAKAMELQQRMRAKGEALLEAEPTPAARDALEAEFERDAEAMQEFGKSIVDELKSLMDTASVHKLFKQVPFAAAAEEDPETALKDRLQRGEIFAYFIIGADPLDPRHGSRYVSQNLTDQKLRSWFAEHATEVIRDAHIQRLEREKGLEQKDVAAIRSFFAFAEERISTTGERKGVETADKAFQYAPIAFVYILWMSVFIAAQMLLTNTVEEKSNRIIEVLLSSVSPVELMHGKIYGIALTGLTVVGSWAFFLFLGVEFAPALFGDGASFIVKLGLDRILSSPLFLGSFVGYFLSGYLLYAAILVAIGSVCNSLKEAQNLVQPVMFALIVPLATMVPIAMDPNGTLARIITYIPFYTPFAMMNRAGGPPPTWEFFASSAVILVSLLLAFRGAAKIFRIGVLMTGKPPNVKEIWKWMWAPVR